MKYLLAGFVIASSLTIQLGLLELKREVSALAARQQEK